MEKKYSLITKGVRDIGDIKKGNKIHILGGMNQVPFKITKILLGTDVYPITPETVNVGAKARLTVTVDKEYPADIDVSLIGERLEMKYIGKEPLRYDGTPDYSDKTKWDMYTIQGVIRGRVVNADYQENWSLNVLPGIDRNGDITTGHELVVWSCPDDIPVVIKGIFIETENPDDMKYLRVYDVRVGKDSQFISGEELPLEALHHMETDTCNVGQLLTINLHNIFSEPCKECGKIKTRAIPITGYVLVETPKDWKK